MNKLTFWYDGGGCLRLREIALFRRLDKKDAIQFVDLTLPDIACPLDRNFMLDRFHARIALRLGFRGFRRDSNLPIGSSCAFVRACNAMPAGC